MIVVVERGLLSLVVSGMAVGTVAGAAFAAPQVILGRPFDVIGDQQVEPSVFIVVKPSRAGGPSVFIGYASLGGDVGKGPIAVIVIKDSAAVAGHVEIGIAVVVEVSNRNSLAVVSFTSDAGLRSDVSKSSVAIVVIEGAAQRLGWFVDIGGGGLDEIQVHEPVLIVVQPGYAGAHGFQVILFVGGSAVLNESDSGGLANIGVADGHAVVGSFRRLACEGHHGGGRSG